MKKIKILQLVLLLFVAINIASCSDDENSSPSLVGRWQKSNTAFVFKSDNTGYYETDLSSFGLGTRKSNFTWRSSAAQLFLTYDGSGGHNKGTFMYYYTLADDVLSVYYDDWDYMGAYKKM